MDGSDQEQTYSDKGSEHAEDNNYEPAPPPPEVNNGPPQTSTVENHEEDDRPVVELFVKVRKLPQTIAKLPQNVLYCGGNALNL